MDTQKDSYLDSQHTFYRGIRIHIARIQTKTLHLDGNVM